MWDIGGQDSLRPSWSTYYTGAKVRWLGAAHLAVTCGQWAAFMATVCNLLGLAHPSPPVQVMALLQADLVVLSFPPLLQMSFGRACSL